jgi:hypothetical protein
MNDIDLLEINKRIRLLEAQVDYLDSYDSKNFKEIKKVNIELDNLYKMLEDTEDEANQETETATQE